MNITHAEYTESGGIHALIDGATVSIPADPANRHYAAVMKSGIEIVPYAPPPAPSQAEKDAANTLTSAQFTYMLALNDWEGVWDAAEAYLKAHDRAEYAKLAAQKSARTYRLSVTLAFVAAMEPVLTAAGVSADLSEATIRAAWADAAGFNG